MNLGKGAALKNGINLVLNYYPNSKCIITADCDGQHKVEDILNLADKFLSQNDNSNITLALGVREFSQEIPLRSKVGNKITRCVFRMLFGKKLCDTQTGLRAFSLDFAKNILAIPYNGYEFEMSMLVEACNAGLEILQVPIKTIYINDNASSHFNPLLDSLSIYAVLFRHIGNSLITALIDFIVFAFMFSLGQSLLVCMISGRVVAGSFNFIVGKTLVFKTKQNLTFEITSYVALTIVLMILSMRLISFLSYWSGISEIAIKPFCELAIFAISFLVQRFFIFVTRGVDSTGGGWSK